MQSYFSAWLPRCEPHALVGELSISIAHPDAHLSKLAYDDLRERLLPLGALAFSAQYIWVRKKEEREVAKRTRARIRIYI